MARDPGGIESDGTPLTASFIRVWRGLTGLPVDLAAVAAFVVLTVVVVLAPVVRETPVRILFGLPFVLFVPGYAFIAALFPERGGHPSTTEGSTADGESLEETDETDGRTAGGIDGLERVALSFGLSIAVVPLIGLVLNFTPWGIRLLPILVSVSGFTLIAVAVAASRRWELPEEEQFRVPYRRWYAAGRNELLAPDTRADAALNVVLVLSIVLAASSVGYAVLVPQEGESFGEFYLLTERDGELVADDYPTEFTRGEGRQLIVGVSNHEHERTNYTVIATLQRVRFADNQSTVLRSERLRRFDLRLDHNETWHRQHTITPTYDGTRLRLRYLLFRGDLPEDPSMTNAYREVHLWVNVSS